MANEGVITLVLLLVVCGCFSALLVTSYFPVTEGWFQDFSDYMSRGQVMYRDFYMFIPPGFPFLMHVISVATSDSFLALRLYGVVEGLVLIAVTYSITRRLASPRVSFVAVLTAFVLYSANLQDVFYGYYQSSLLLALVVLYFGIRCYETFDGGRLRHPILFGLASGGLLLFKQSTGVVFPVVTGLSLIAMTVQRDRARALRYALIGLVTCLAVVGIAAGLLAVDGALQPALDQVLGGSSAKGDVGTLLFGFLGRVPIAGTASLVVAVLGITILAKLGPSRDRAWPPAGGLVVVGVASALAVAMFAWFRLTPGTAVVREGRQYLVYAAFFLLASLCLYLVGDLARGRRGDRPLRLLMGIAAFTLMYVHGMSGVLEEHALLLPAALLIATALSAPIAWPLARDAVIYVVCAFLLVTITVQRNATPYHWWGVNWLPATWTATSAFEDPHLAGISASPGYAGELNAIYEAVEANERPGDTMYSFPHINYFNVMAGLPSPTFGKVDYFDVAPDSVAIRDAELLRQHPPTFLVWMELTPAEWSAHEDLFRGGRPSGEREIERAVHELIASGAYHSLGQFSVGESDPIGLYMLKAR